MNGKLDFRFCLMDIRSILYLLYQGLWMKIPFSLWLFFTWSSAIYLFFSCN